MKTLYPIILFFLLFSPIHLFSQGLKIQGNDFLIDDRSSYMVFQNEPPLFRERLVLNFEIAPQNIRDAFSIGYILRIKNEETNTTYNILYNDQGHETVFKLNHEGRDVLIEALFNKSRLYEHQWIKMNIDFDLITDSVELDINGEKFRAGGLRLEKNWRPRIHFGRSEHVIDIPTYCLRNLTVTDGEKSYYFPLNENEGTNVHDINKKIIGNVQNPVWLINDAYYWKAANIGLISQTVAGSTINTDTQEIYYFNEDSITFYNVRTHDIYTRRYTNKCPVYMRLGTNFLDRERNRLYVYEVSDLLGGDVTMAYLDLNLLTWTVVSQQILPIQLHHHSSYFDEKNRRYIIFGGFGNTYYSKNFYAFDLSTNQWETLQFMGDEITPRYFTSLGHSEDGNILYLFGGMGNESGDQAVGRVYYYELYRIDMDTKVVKKMWEIPWRKENVVPVRGMVLTDDKSFYTLCYPEHFSKSMLKLYRFSIGNGNYEILGDSIPIVSEKITTNANLYYNKRTNELYSVVQEFDYNDTGSQAKIYSLSYPPVTMEGLMYYNQTTDLSRIWVVLIVVFLNLCGILFYRWRRRNKNIARALKKSQGQVNVTLPEFPKEGVLASSETVNRANSIFLFGEFSIHDRNNRDITYMLSSKLRQAFFLILQYSLKNGITTQELSDLLWPNKPEDKVKNSRGVTLNNLRKILGELDGISLVHEKGYYKIIITPDCYCDYVKCLQQMSAPAAEMDTDELIPVISRGKFLKSVDIPLLDSFKEYIERKLEPVLLISMENVFKTGDYQSAIILADAVFHIDPFNEDALYCLLHSLSKMNQIDEARRRYLLFASEYKNTMDEDYSKSFTDLAG